MLLNTVYSNDLNKKKQKKKFFLISIRTIIAEKLSKSAFLD